MTRVYLDNAATTAMRAEAINAYVDAVADEGYNASSLHAEGRAARARLDTARDAIALQLQCARNEVTLTGGGSEADNLAIFGIAFAKPERRHVVTSAIEHHAVLHAVEELVDRGWEATVLDVDRDGRVDPDRFAGALRPDTALASVVYVNNELGTVQPIAQLAQLARERGVAFHTDAVQAALYYDLDVGRLGVDLLALSAHKCYGPKGIGALYVRRGTALRPLIYGGGQEFGRRAGTENVAAAAAFACALELAGGEREAAAVRVRALRDRLEARICTSLQGVRVNGGGAERAPHISNLSFDGVQTEPLLMRLDLQGIAASGGSACTSGALEPSHVLAALGLEDRWLHGVLRFSVGRENTEEQVDRAAELTVRAARELRAISSLPT